MRLEVDREERLHALTMAIARHAPERDADGAFPHEAFAELAAVGLLADPPVAHDAMTPLLSLLAAVGHGDLSVGRIFEGHVNACFLIEEYGTTAQSRRFREIASGGGMFGVWNTDLPEDPLRLENGHLVGKKNFASGIDGLSHAIVTVSDEAGRRMIVVPTTDLPVDRSWWRPMGMRASGSHVANMTGMAVEPDWLLGKPDDYILQPWFSAGAIRFLAVQVGGMHAVLDTSVEHLRRADRASNPYQAHRLAKIAVAVETGYLWLDKVAEAWTAAAAAGSHEELKAYLMAAANAARLSVETAAMIVLEEAERAIGATGMIAPHPFERLSRDLRTYLRQPNPDGAAAAFGATVAGGQWTPARKPRP